jgi:hypothetical protein
VKDHRFLISLCAIPAVILIVVPAYVILEIRSDEARQSEQYPGRSGDSQTKPAIVGGNSGGSQFQREEPVAPEAEKERQKVTDCVGPTGGIGPPLRCTTLESDLASVLHKKKQQEEVAKKEAERLALPAERKHREKATAKVEAERQETEAERKRQDEAAKLEAERLALEAEKKASKLEAERVAREAEKKRQDEAAKLEAERVALETEKRRQEEATAKVEAERQETEAERKRQDEAANLEAQRLALEAEKKAAKLEAERVAREAEKKRQEEAAKLQAERVALETEKRRQEEATAKNAAERLVLETEKKRLEETAREDAERLASAADKKRQQEEFNAARPIAAGEAPATEKTDQQIAVPNLMRPPSAPETTLETWVTGTLKPPVSAVQGAAGTVVSAQLPVLAPSRVVLTYPRNDKLAAERTTALRRALTAANLEVVEVEAVDASRPTPGLGYYFRSDHDAAVDVSHRIQPLLGPVEPALLELRGKVPPPGTVEIAVPGRGVR